MAWGGGGVAGVDGVGGRHGAARAPSTSAARGQGGRAKCASPGAGCRWHANHTGKAVGARESSPYPISTPPREIGGIQPPHQPATHSPPHRHTHPPVTD